MYPHERSLVKKMADKAFALIGINTDSNRAELKKVLKKEEITWRSFWNGKNGTKGPITQQYKVAGHDFCAVLLFSGLAIFPA